MPDDRLEPIDVTSPPGGGAVPSGVGVAPPWFWRWAVGALVVATLALVVLAAATVGNWSASRRWGSEEVCLTRISVSRADPPSGGAIPTAASCH